MASSAAAIDQAATSKSVDESLWWDSFVALFEELDAAPLSSDPFEDLVKKVRSNHAWFLESVIRFKSPNQASRIALDSPKISVGSHTLVIKPEHKEIALRVSSCLCLDEVQSYILVNRLFAPNHSFADVESQDILHMALRQYYFERQCLLKCIRCIFVHAVCMREGSSSTDAILGESLELICDGLERKLLCVLIDLLSSASSEKNEVDFTVLWVEESVIEDNLILDILFLVYYDNFCTCSCEQWKKLCSLFKDIFCGSCSIGKLATSPEAMCSFDHAKTQLLLILIETLDLENLLHMVHDEVPLRQGGLIFLLSDIQEMDILVSSISILGRPETSPLVLSWAVFVCLLLSLPDRMEYNFIMDIDHVAYLQQAMVAEPFTYILGILRGDAMRDSDGPISGYLSVLRTLVSAFIAAYEVNYQTAGNMLDLILDILFEIYNGEDTLSMQFWDKDSFVDGPIRSLLYMLENEYPFRTVQFVRFLSALCSGDWSAECVYNFLEKMSGVTLLSELPGGSEFHDSNSIVEARNQLDVPSVDGLVIPIGTYGQVLKVIDANVALVRWEFAHSGLFLLLCRVAQKSSLCDDDELFVILNLLDRLVSSSKSLCCKLLILEKSLPTQAAQNNGIVEVHVRIDFVKIICTLTSNLVQDVYNARVVSICIHILSETLKCVPCHVMEVVSSSNIFGTINNSLPSNTWLLSGGLARMLLSCEENGDCPQLTTSVLDFTIQLLEKGGEDNLVSALVIFSIQYVLVNHMHWRYKLTFSRWVVTLKVLEVMKSCIKAMLSFSKLGSIIRGILFLDSSVYNILCQILCLSPEKLESSNISHSYELKDIERIQLAVSYALDVVYGLLADSLKFQETVTNVSTFLKKLLSSTSKPIPIVRAVAAWINFFRNYSIQLAAAKVFSMLCILASSVQPYRIDNVSVVIDAMQINQLRASIFHILEEESDSNHELQICIFDLLTSAASHQPAFLASLILSEDMKLPEATADGTKKQHSLAFVVEQKEGITVLISKYIKRSEILIKRSPHLMLSILNLLKALWDGGVHYLHMLEKIKSSDMFWEHLSASLSAVQLETKCSVRNHNDFDVQCTRYRYLCQATVLEIMARELFLHGKLVQNEIPEKLISTGSSKDQAENGLHTRTSASSDILHPGDILFNWCGSKTLENLIKLYSSSGYNEEVIFRAKVAVCLSIVHLMVTLSISNTASLSISLVEKINNIFKKLSDHPAFSALLAQYSSHGYSEGSDIHRLVLEDLYFHMEGELDGRQITQGPFKELSHFLLELGTFQCDLSKYEVNNGRHANHISMFDVTLVRTELGMELWDHTGWKALKEIAERMLLHMHEANLVMSHTASKYAALKALIAVISMVNNQNAEKTKSREFNRGISPALVESCIRYVCKCMQETEDSLLPALSAPELSLNFFSAQTELLLSLSKILFKKNLQKSDQKQYLPASLLLINASGSGIRFLTNIHTSPTLVNKAVKYLLTLLLTSIEYISPKAYTENTSDLEVDHIAEVSVTSIGLLPILCKYAEHPEHADLSLASIDVLVKGFLAPNTWLPILERHLQLQSVVQRVQQRDSLISTYVTLNFLLTLARTKSGAQMLYSGNLFSSLKVLFNCSLDDNSFSNDFDWSNFSSILDNGEKPSHLWGLCMAIITSMIYSLGDAPSSTDILDGIIRYLFFEKACIVSHSLSMPSFPSDDPSKKRVRDQRTQTSLTALVLTENTLAFLCVLAGDQSSWRKGMKEIDSGLRETCIHLLAFISKGVQCTGDTPGKSVFIFCPPTRKEEIELKERPSFAGSRQGWFRLTAVGLSSKNKAFTAANRQMSLEVKDLGNGTADTVQQSHFSDLVAVQMYRIAFLLLKFLCMQAKAAAKRAEELELIDLAHFPELPMPEILHGLQDQAISIITEVCEAHGQKSMQAETEGVCLLLLQILEKALYLELCVSQSCGIRPVMGRIEDFSKEIKLMMQVIEPHSKFKVLLRSLWQIIALVYPGLFRSGSL